MSIAVYWLEEELDGNLEPAMVPRVKMFNEDELLTVLKFAETLRDTGALHVSISTQLSDNVGKPGVNSVQDGKTPDGHDYEWSKQHRGAAPRKD